MAMDAENDIDFFTQCWITCQKKKIRHEEEVEGKLDNLSNRKVKVVNGPFRCALSFYFYQNGWMDG
jgi:hypothetical protein